MLAEPDQASRSAQVIDCAGPAYERFLQSADARGAQHRSGGGLGGARGAHHPRDDLRGGKACRPLIARDGLSHALIEPALAFLETRNVPRSASASGCARSTLADGKAAALDFGDETVPLTLGDRVILAVPPMVAPRSCPICRRRRVPRHRECAFPRRAAGRPAADDRRAQRDRRMDLRLSGPALGHDQRRRPAARPSREELAATIWREVAAVAGLPRASCRRGRSCANGARPSRRRRRRTPSVPAPHTAFGNLYLAGDWTDTGLPATIEGAIRSGNRAADLALRHLNNKRMTDTTTCTPPAPALNKLDALEQRIARATERCSPTSSRTGTGCSSSKPTPRSRPNTCCCGTTSARRRTSSSSARSPSICAASRARMAAGRCSTTATST